MPKFSIIIPVYNVAPYLRECLDSVLAQTFTDWEAICVDDGSTDGSGAILDEYGEKVERLGGGGQRTGKFVVIHQQNAGVSAARNAALDVAKGEWIVFVDSDDILCPEYFQEFVDFEGKADVNFFPVKTCYEDGSEKICRGPDVHLIGQGPLLLRYCLALARSESGQNLLGYTWNKIIRSSVVARHHIRFVEGLSVSEDEVFACECLMSAQNASSLARTGYVYRWRKTGLTHATSKNTTLLADSFYELAVRNPESALFKLILMRYLMVLSDAYVQTRSYSCARRIIESARRFRVVNFIRGRKGRLIELCCRMPFGGAEFFFLVTQIGRSFSFAVEVPSYSMHVNGVRPHGNHGVRRPSLLA